MWNLKFITWNPKRAISCSNITTVHKKNNLLNIKPSLWLVPRERIGVQSGFFWSPATPYARFTELHFRNHVGLRFCGSPPVHVCILVLVFWKIAVLNWNPDIAECHWIPPSGCDVHFGAFRPWKKRLVGIQCNHAWSCALEDLGDVAVLAVQSPAMPRRCSHCTIHWQAYPKLARASFSRLFLWPEDICSPGAFISLNFLCLRLNGLQVYSDPA